MLKRLAHSYAVSLFLVILVTAGGSTSGSKMEMTEKERERSRVEIVFYNGNIYTMDDGMPKAEAIAVGGGWVLDVGGTDEVLSRCRPGVHRVDLGGRTVIPGLVDAHAHFLGFAKLRAWVDLVGTSSLEDVMSKVSERAGEEEGGHWILGRGWDQNDWPETHYPHKEIFEKIVSGRPVYLVRTCGHAAFVNDEALRLAHITSETPDPPGGKILRDEQGAPTGVLIDEAMELVSSKIPPLSREEKKQYLVEAAHECLSVGLVGLHEMGITSETAAIYKELLQEEVLPFRINAYYQYDEADLDSVLEAGPVRGYADHHLSVSGVKFYIDGSLGARSAALLEDYSDDPGNRGILIIEPEALHRKILTCHRKGFQAAVHAIGDRGISLVLDIYERILSEYPSENRRHRVEHAQIVSPRDIPRFASLGLIPSMQFTHCTSDMPWAGERLGSERLKGAYAWRSFLSEGCTIPGGSDFPVESINPFLGIYAAVTRKDLHGHPEGGWSPEQCLTVEEAVKAFTVHAAYAVHEEEMRGTLSAGKLADFIVISHDIMNVTPENIPLIKVHATVLGGEVVYRSEELPPRDIE